MGRCIICGRLRGTKTVKFELLGTVVVLHNVHSRCAHGWRRVVNRLMGTSEVYEEIQLQPSFYYNSGSALAPEWKPIRNHH